VGRVNHLDADIWSLDADEASVFLGRRRIPDRFDSHTLPPTPELDAP